MLSCASGPRGLRRERMHGPSIAPEVHCVKRQLHASAWTALLDSRQSASSRSGSLGGPRLEEAACLAPKLTHPPPGAGLEPSGAASLFYSCWIAQAGGAASRYLTRSHQTSFPLHSSLPQQLKLALPPLNAPMCPRAHTRTDMPAEGPCTLTTRAPEGGPLAHESSSPRKMVLSDAPEAMMGCLGWNTTLLTLPVWPGSLYRSRQLLASHTFTCMPKGHVL